MPRHYLGAATVPAPKGIAVLAQLGQILGTQSCVVVVGLGCRLAAMGSGVVHRVPLYLPSGCQGHFLCYHIVRSSSLPLHLPAGVGVARGRQAGQPCRSQGGVVSVGLVLHRAATLGAVSDGVLDWCPLCRQAQGCRQPVPRLYPGAATVPASKGVAVLAQLGQIAGTQSCVVVVGLGCRLAATLGAVADGVLVNFPPGCQHLVTLHLITRLYPDTTTVPTVKVVPLLGERGQVVDVQPGALVHLLVPNHSATITVVADGALLPYGHQLPGVRCHAKVVYLTFGKVCLEISLHRMSRLLAVIRLPKGHVSQYAAATGFHRHRLGASHRHGVEHLRAVGKLPRHGGSAKGHQVGLAFGKGGGIDGAGAAMGGGKELALAVRMHQKSVGGGGLVPLWACCRHRQGNLPSEEPQRHIVHPLLASLGVRDAHLDLCVHIRLCQMAVEHLQVYGLGGSRGHGGDGNALQILAGGNTQVGVVPFHHTHGHSALHLAHVGDGQGHGVALVAVAVEVAVKLFFWGYGAGYLEDVVPAVHQGDGAHKVSAVLYRQAGNHDDPTVGGHGHRLGVPNHRGREGELPILVAFGGIGVGGVAAGGSGDLPAMDGGGSRTAGPSHKAHQSHAVARVRTALAEVGDGAVHDDAVAFLGKGAEARDHHPFSGGGGTYIIDCSPILLCHRVLVHLVVGAVVHAYPGSPEEAGRRSAGNFLFSRLIPLRTRITATGAPLAPASGTGAYLRPAGSQHQRQCQQAPSNHAHESTSSHTATSPYFPSFWSPTQPRSLPTNHPSSIPAQQVATHNGMAAAAASQVNPICSNLVRHTAGRIALSTVYIFPNHLAAGIIGGNDGAGIGTAVHGVGSKAAEHQGVAVQAQLVEPVVGTSRSVLHWLLLPLNHGAR